MVVSVIDPLQRFSPEDVFLIVEIKCIAPHLISSRRKEKMEDKVSLNKGLAKLMI